MEPTVSLKQHKIIATIGLCIMLIAVSFLARGWIRMTVVPKSLNLTYGKQAHDLLERQDARVDHPLQLFYGSAVKKHSGCRTVAAQGFRIVVDCEALYQGYKLLPQDADGQKKAVNDAAATHELLMQHGWKSGSNGVTLKSLVIGTYLGKDYSPDAAYTISFGAYSCLMDTTIAYANPKPPAINSFITCSRSVQPFGFPNSYLH